MTTRTEYLLNLTGEKTLLLALSSFPKPKSRSIMVRFCPDEEGEMKAWTLREPVIKPLDFLMREDGSHYLVVETNESSQSPDTRTLVLRRFTEGQGDAR